MRSLTAQTKPNSPRAGFTLIELMVVVTIMLILFGMTAYAVKSTRDGDKVRAAAAQVQSFLAGARDRAIYAKEDRGVRFFVNPANPRSVSAMAYIQPGQRWNHGTVSLERLDIDPKNNVPDRPEVVVVRGERLGWWQLKRRGLLTDGSRIRIPEDSDVSYEVDTSLINITAPPTNEDFLLLRIPYMDGGGDTNSVAAFQGLTYSIELPSQLLPQEPSLLPEAAVIDLDGSKIPSVWRPDPLDAAGQFSPYMDIFFSPRGNVVGSSAGTGIVHFYVCDAEESLNLKTRFLEYQQTNSGWTLANFEDFLLGQPFVPADEIVAGWLPETSAAEPFLTKDRKIVTVVTQTGGITVSAVDGTDLIPTAPSGLLGFADSPYAFAQSGKGAK